MLNSDKGWNGEICQTPDCECNNHGTCTEPNVCNCDAYWGGAECQFEKCQENSCSAGFTCEDQVSDDFICLCSDENPCQNSALCTAGQDQGWELFESEKK